jgi:D-beta-D-heptose 7-phosphate kinase/D-beta-D-heptose 1-phosphate adenosyltransferase
MKPLQLTTARVDRLLREGRKTRIVVLGDAMLDQFVWGSVARISPEAPVPIVYFQRESFMPGGAANVARNLTALGMPAELLTVIGRDAAGDQLRKLLVAHNIGCAGVLASRLRQTSVKTRIVAHQQQLVRIDRESREGLDGKMTGRMLEFLESDLKGAAAIIVGDYGKGSSRSRCWMR